MSVNDCIHQNFLKSDTKLCDMSADHILCYRLSSVNIMAPDFVLCMSMSCMNNGNGDLIVYIR